MNPEQMTQLTEAANLLWQAEARIEAVRDTVEKEHEGLPERLHGGSIDDDADSAFGSLELAVMSIASALTCLAEVAGEDDLKPPVHPEPLPDKLPPLRRRSP
jgi:hypothetical protein